ncbi:N-acetylmuramoyl-L-alanine amidase, family 2 [Plesiocystis pacifica SIR-1]|uniref:N-acetylmuramoyl-L-alanine amidase, family 2 n=1 Tax=Plesiocystis pacifica SIR-1 TaxID=391625 RepID=A6G3J1_9BACT|nr:peptidoglycan recognition family protein [Plesiocystis pacifica]EDM79598.1 N-acetylmuramoyl-L-alanine amidase, family 2 [Plesiocystis pacifica SIR-1]
MIGFIVGFTPIAVAGAFALWTRVDRRPEIINLLDASPTSKRHKRSKGFDAVVLHQTGFSRGNDPTRYRKVTAHFVILPDGKIIQLHPLSAKLWAADGFNNRSVSIEFAGNFKAATGKWWSPDKYGADEPTPAQIQAGRALLRMLKSIGIRHVFAHRQSSAKRGNDPGPQIWASVGEWAIRSLELDNGGPNYAIGGGSPIPDQWRRPTP